ncbi:zinc finger BED domain-containing protein RICESLEEPER 2-like protein [Tanacetum coccineum]
MTLESHSVNQTSVEVDQTDMEEVEEFEVQEEDEVEEQPKGRKKTSAVWNDFDELKLKKGETLLDKRAKWVKKKSFMALTGHFIDNDWNLVKKVLNFCRLDGHRGIDIGKGVENCLEEWGFTNILSISVDNASANDGAITFMKLILEKYDACLLSGEWIHIRCAAHVVNLIVQDGIKHVGSSIESIRCGIKWIKKSGARIEKFNKCARSARCESTKSLILDCPTRWNSTYNMLVVAHEYKDAFTRYDLEEEQLDVIVDDHYGREGISVVVKKQDYIKGKMKLLYEDYIRIHAPSSTSSSTLGKRPRSTNTSHELDHGDMLRRRMKTGQSSSSSTSELDKYNGEFCEPFDKNVHFDILLWWKVNSLRFPILSLMARDLLAIPISTVASESVFSTSGRVLDSFRSSLGDKTIECLVCAQDWLRISLNPKNEDMDTIAKIEKELMEQERARLND